MVETDEVDGPPQAWAVAVNDQTVMLKDLPLNAILRIVEGEDTGATMLQLLAQPLSDFGVAVKIVEECAKHAGVADSAGWVAEQMDRSWLDFTKLFVQVDDDLPSLVVDGIPKVDGGSTLG